MEGLKADVRTRVQPVRRVSVALLAIAVLTVLAACGDDSKSAGNSVEAFCSQSAADESIFSAAGPGATDSSRALAAFEDLTKRAPAEIKSDMTTIFTFLKTSSTGTPDPAQAASVTAASQRVVQFFKDKCHVDLAGATDESFSAIASSISN